MRADDLTVGDKYVNRAGHPVKIMNRFGQKEFGQTFTVKNLKTGVLYGVDIGGNYKSLAEDHPNDLVDRYTMSPTSYHMVMLRMIKKIPEPAFKGKFFELLMESQHKTPSRHQAEMRFNELVSGGLLTEEDVHKSVVITLTPKALEYLQ